MGRRKRKRGRPPRKELTDAQRKAIVLLVWGRRREWPREKIARACGVSRMALWKWERRSRLFQRELEREKSRFLDELNRRFRRRMSARIMAGDLDLMEKVLRACDFI